MNSEDNNEEMITKENKPLSSKHRNLSSSLFFQGEEEQKPDNTSKDDDRVSQLQLQTDSNEIDSIEAAHAHVALAEHFMGKGDRDAATEHYTEAHAIYDALGEKNEVSKVLKKLGDINLEENTHAAKELYEAALDIEVTVHGHYLPQTLNAVGVACLKNDDFRSAMEFHRQALQIQKKTHSSSGDEKQSRKYDMYDTLVHIGNVYYSERNNLTNIRSNGVDYEEFISSGFLSWIANAHDMRGEYSKAINFYEETLQIYMTKEGKEEKRDTALTLNRLGSLTRELGRYDEVRIVQFYSFIYCPFATNISTFMTKTGHGLPPACFEHSKDRQWPR